LNASIKAAERRLSEIAVLKKHILNYSKTRDTYVAYRKSGYSKKFFEIHREQIILHKAAKEAFDQLGVKKLPRMKDSNAEYAEVRAGKKKAYAEYRNARAEMLREGQQKCGTVLFHWRRKNSKRSSRRNLQTDNSRGEEMGSQLCFIKQNRHGRR